MNETQKEQYRQKKNRLCDVMELGRRANKVFEHLALLEDLTSKGCRAIASTISQDTFPYELRAMVIGYGLHDAFSKVKRKANRILAHLKK